MDVNWIFTCEIRISAEVGCPEEVVDSENHQTVGPRRCNLVHLRLGGGNIGAFSALDCHGSRTDLVGGRNGGDEIPG